MADKNTQEWNNSYPESQQPLIDKYKQKLADEFSHDYFEKFGELSLNETLGFKGSKQELEDFAHAPVDYLKSLCLSTDEDTATQLKATFFEAYSNHYASTTDESFLDQVVYFTLLNDVLLDQYLYDIMDYIKQHVSYVRTTKKGHEVGTDYENVAAMFDMVDKAMHNNATTGLYIADINDHDYEDDWAALVNEKLKAPKPSCPTPKD